MLNAGLAGRYARALLNAVAEGEAVDEIDSRGKRVVAAELLHYGLAKMLGKHVLELGHLAGIGEESGYRGTVPVAA